MTGVLARKRSLREQRKAETRRLVLLAARRCLARAGFAGASIDAIAREAGIASGTVYLYFDNRAALFGEVFEIAATWEEDAIARVASAGAPRERLRLSVRTFLTRALRGRRLAYALIAEPVDPVVEAARLASRARFAGLFARTVEAGVAEGSLHAIDAALAGKFIVGAITECLVGPLSPATRGPDLAANREGLIRNVEDMCLSAVGYSLTRS